MFRLRIFRVYLKMAMPLPTLVRLPFHDDHETCSDTRCPLCFSCELW